MQVFIGQSHNCHGLNGGNLEDKQLNPKLIKKSHFPLCNSECVAPLGLYKAQGVQFSSVAVSVWGASGGSVRTVPLASVFVCASTQLQQRSMVPASAPEKRFLQLPFLFQSRRSGSGFYWPRNMSTCFLHELFEHPQGAGTSLRSSRDMPPNRFVFPRASREGTNLLTPTASPHPTGLVSGLKMLISVFFFLAWCGSDLVPGALRLGYPHVTPALS